MSVNYSEAYEYAFKFHVTKSDNIPKTNIEFRLNVDVVRLKSKGHKLRPGCAIPIVGFLPSLRICGSDEIM